MRIRRRTGVNRRIQKERAQMAVTPVRYQEISAAICGQYQLKPDLVHGETIQRGASARSLRQTTLIACLLYYFHVMRGAPCEMIRDTFDIRHNSRGRCQLVGA